jgi:hypothetical protein
VGSNWARDEGQAAASFAAGWHRHLDTLRYLTVGSTPQPGRPSWDQLRERYLSLI